MKHVIVFKPRAEQDLGEILAYIAHHFSPERAWGVIDGIRTDIDGLVTFPGRYAIARESGRALPVIRAMLSHGYRVLFFVDGRTVHVLHIRHGSRRPARRSAL